MLCVSVRIFNRYILEQTTCFPLSLIFSIMMDRILYGTADISGFVLKLLNGFLECFISPTFLAKSLAFLR